MRLDLGPDLAALKAQALREIDAAAEAARLRYITPGAGQALEYQSTEAEARDYHRRRSGGEAAAVEDYPFLQAECDALLAATGQAPDPAVVATQVVAEADAWVAVGSAIKALRRGAKLRVEAAASPAAVRQALQIPWPTP